MLENPTVSLWPWETALSYRILVRWAEAVQLFWWRHAVLVESHPFRTTHDLQTSFYHPLCYDSRDHCLLLQILHTTSVILAGSHSYFVVSSLSEGKNRWHDLIPNPRRLYRTLLFGIVGRCLWLESFILDVSPISVCCIFRNGLSGRQMNSLLGATVCCMTGGETTPDEAVHGGKTSSRNDFNHIPRPSIPENRILCDIAGCESLSRLMNRIY